MFGTSITEQINIPREVRDNFLLVVFYSWLLPWVVDAPSSEMEVVFLYGVSKCHPYDSKINSTNCDLFRLEILLTPTNIVLSSLFVFLSSSCCWLTNIPSWKIVSSTWSASKKMRDAVMQKIITPSVMDAIGLSKNTLLLLGDKSHLCDQEQPDYIFYKR